MDQQNDPHQINLPDTQNLSDHRRIPIRKVGISQLEMPKSVHFNGAHHQNTVISMSLFVSLPSHLKGTHMSRFVEVVQSSDGAWNLMNLESLLQDLNASLPSQSVGLQLSCPIFKLKHAPVSGKPGPMKYQFLTSASLSDGQVSTSYQLKTWVTTLCPCSKAISQASAHNQRGEVTLNFTGSPEIDPFFLCQIIEKSASSELYALLKRVDEKNVTEKAYENPVFVEDLVRNIASKFIHMPSIHWFSVEAENFESIHLHNAYACVDSSDLKPD